MLKGIDPRQVFPKPQYRYNSLRKTPQNIQPRKGINYVKSLYSHNALDPVSCVPTAFWYTAHIILYLALTGTEVLNPLRGADIFPLFSFYAHVEAL
jgi:hypothetical protein